MRRFVFGWVAFFLAACGTENTLDLASPTGTPTPQPCDVAGNVCSLGGFDGVGDGGAALSAGLGVPYFATRDAAGNIYIADTYAHRIRKIDVATGLISTIAGIGRYEYPVFTGFPGPLTPVNYPISIVATPDGWVMWSSWSEAVLYGLDPETGDVSVVAGTDEWTGYANGPALQVPLWCGDESNLTSDAAGNVYIPQNQEDVVRVWNRTAAPITVATVVIPAGHIGTIAGTGVRGAGASDVPALSSMLADPTQAYPMPDGSILVSEHLNNRIRRIGTDGVIRAFAGTGVQSYSGDGGPAATATFYQPIGVAYDEQQGRLFVWDHNRRVRMINMGATPQTFGGVTVDPGEIDRIAGTGGWGFPYLDGGSSLQTYFAEEHAAPFLDVNGNVVIVDTWNNVLRVVKNDATTSTIAGYSGVSALAQYQRNPRALSKLPDGRIAFAGGLPYVSAYDVATGERTNIAGIGTITDSGDGGPATAAGLYPNGIAVGPDGSIYVADDWHLKVRRIDPAGVITTIAGTGGQVQGGSGDGGPAIAAAFDNLETLTVDALGNVFVLDDDQVRVINRGAAPLTVAGVTVQPAQIERIAGTPNTPGFSGDGGPARSALLNADYQSALLVAGGALFIAEFQNHRIRRVDLATGTITTFAGTGVDGYRGDAGPASEAWVGNPTGVAADATYLYWAQEQGAVIRRAPLAGGTVETLAGTGESGIGPNGVPARDSALLWPTSVLVDGSTLYFADWSKRVRRMTLP